MLNFLIPIRALAVALIGVLFASWWFQGLGVVVVVLSVGLVAGALALDGLGRAALPRYPTLAIILMEGWLLAPIILASIAAGVVVLVAVVLTVPDTASTETKKLTSGLATGITAFITSTFISWAGDDKDSTLGDHIRSAFQAKFKRSDPKMPPTQGVHYFKADSPGERWVFSDEYGGVVGWSLSARWKR